MGSAITWPVEDTRALAEHQDASLRDAGCHVSSFVSGSGHADRHCIGVLAAALARRTGSWPNGGA
jgi:hypothetical protein